MKSLCSSYRQLVIPEQVGHLSLVFQQGVYVNVTVGISLDRLLSDFWGLSSDFIEQNIQTLFLDSKPVDDLNAAIVGDRSVIALSAAMPGLVGASMRRGGYYSGMRHNISLKNQVNIRQTVHSGCIKVKLFNTLIKDMGPLLLKNGFFVKAGILQDSVPDLVKKRIDENAFVFICSDISKI
ncbi:hypothetical protein QUF76_04875 [Desulfobacterales bacterium HSG16]|nr:hypothetical protein [Desulfobacterales bacterium HSG16]